MHKQILEHATPEQIKEFTTDFISMLKGTNEELYEDAEEWLYCVVYDDHFSDWLVEKATKMFTNEDGSIGAHWTLEQTTNVAKQYGIKFEHFNEYDWHYVMNMMYSDYYSVLGNSTENYVKMSKAFLCDIDAPKGKAFKYYKAMKR